MNDQLCQYELMRDARGGANHEDAVHKLVPAAVIGRPVQVVNGEWRPSRYPGLDNCHGNHPPICHDCDRDARAP